MPVRLRGAGRRKYRGRVRKYRFAFRPRWLALHLFSVALAVTMVFLGRWQLHVSESKHFSIQNFGYTIQWWLFSAFALFFWSRLVRDGERRLTAPEEDEARPAGEADEPVNYRRYVMPTSDAGGGDPMRTAYNDYLADLAKRDAQAS